MRLQLPLGLALHLRRRHLQIHHCNNLREREMIVRSYHVKRNIRCEHVTYSVAGAGGGDGGAVDSCSGGGGAATVAPPPPCDLIKAIKSKSRSPTAVG